MAKIEIKKGVARPDNLRARPSGESKYPVADMEIDDYFEVDKSFYSEQPYDGKKHKNRVNSSVRAYALRWNKEQKLKSAFGSSDLVQKSFTVLLLENGNIGVWRDK